MNFFADKGEGLPARSGGRQGAGGHRSQHCVLFAVDVAGFTDPARNDRVQLAVREALYAMVPGAFDDALLGWDDCLHEDRGDGILVIVPARMPSVGVIDPLVGHLARRLRRHNGAAPDGQVVRLRVAVHIGEVHRDAHGLAGTSVNHLFRLLDAPALKRALADSGDDLAVIASDYFYDGVIRHADGSVDPTAFWPADVTVKETRARGWIHLPDSPAGTAELRGDAGTVDVPATEVRHPEGDAARRAHGTVRPPASPPNDGGRGPGFVFYGDVTVHGDAVAGDKIVREGG
ncbi:hypothetical protein [Thermomonospora umbrina]|uniref:Guanylate cyclase domain-containing protein n=1 Tax=Thermomonospora umbrina TaxID=111806 RepID=A0A3D9SYD9_9ACTN|nr:hypothetical protein [Thermomonospora umbrina]REF00970.1 hypothetical protein DFJ69_6568 [Thermomonospora umbrina]